MIPGLRIFCGFYAKGQRFLRVRLRWKFPNSFKNSKDSHPQAKGDHHNTDAGIKISLFIAEIPNIPSTN
jgi:hypothetical protein